jgi:hypothetical protein
MLPKLPFHLNAKTMSKSSHHEDYDVVLTFVGAALMKNFPLENQK